MNILKFLKLITIKYYNQKKYSVILLIVLANEEK